MSLSFVSSVPDIFGCVTYQLFEYDLSIKPYSHAVIRNKRTDSQEKRYPIVIEHLQDLHWLQMNVEDVKTTTNWLLVELSAEILQFAVL